LARSRIPLKAQWPDKSVLRLDSGVEALAIISNPKTQLSLVISQFQFNPPSSCVLESVTQRLGRNPVDFIADDRMKIPGRTFQMHKKFGPIQIDLLSSQFFSQ
jgi:hypothetical protein